MAIVQISQITNRKGLAENLPQLAGAELGWSTDTRQLYIGNGTLEEGAPVIGNTEILTEFSDILAFNNFYTYKGEAAGYTVQTGPSGGTPVSQSLQSWLDQFASVLDFGAVGDGTTDCTDAINRALYQLYCREVNPQIRRSLFFPAGTYLVSDTINIPPYATLYGEGVDNSVITLVDNDDSSVNPYVAQTADSLQQTGVNIGSNGATPPQYITITNLGFRSLDPESQVFYVNAANNCRFQNVGFYGPLTESDLTVPGDETVATNFGSTPGLITSQITFDGCVFSGTTYGVDTDQQIEGVTFTNSKFDTLRNGIRLGTGTVVLGGPTGTRIMGNMFDNIYNEGIIFGDVILNASGHNIFYNVGNHFSVGGTPATSIIDIQTGNNISISDLFERAANASALPRIQLNNVPSIATTNGSQLAVGTYVRESGSRAELPHNTSGNVFELDATLIKAFSVNYTMVKDYTYRTGTIMVATDVGDSSLGISSTDDFVENGATGITLEISQAGDTVSLDYANPTTYSGFIYYSITHLA